MDVDALVVGSEVSGSDVRPTRNRSTLLVGAGLALLIGLLVGMSVVRAPQMSPFDEGTHADYAYQVAHGHIPYAGSRGAVEITREAMCHGVSVPGLTPLPPCGASNPPTGENYNFGHPPLYYAITGVIARIVDAAVPGGHFVTAARLVGMGWLWAGAMMLFLAVRTFGVPWPFAAAAAALLPLVPGVLYANSTVTNDAAAVLSGGLALFVLARVLAQGRTDWLFPTVTALGVTATKVLNALPLLAVAAALFVLAVVAWGRDDDRVRAWSLLKVTLGICAGFLVVYEGWTLFQATRGVPGWVSPIAGVHGRPIDGWPVNELLSTSLTGFNVIGGYFLPKSINGHAILLWSRALNIAVLGAPLMAMVAWSRRSIFWTMGAVTFGSLAAYPLIVEAQIYLSSRLYFSQLNPRYGLSLVPCVLACVAVLAWKRDALRMLLAATGVGSVAMLATVGGLLT